MYKIKQIVPTTVMQREIKLPKNSEKGESLIGLINPFNSIIIIKAKIIISAKEIIVKRFLWSCPNLKSKLFLKEKQRAKAIKSKNNTQSNKSAQRRRKTPFFLPSVP